MAEGEIGVAHAADVAAAILGILTRIYQEVATVAAEIEAQGAAAEASII